METRENFNTVRQNSLDTALSEESLDRTERMNLQGVLESLDSIGCRSTPISNHLFCRWKQIHCGCLPPPIFLLYTHQLFLVRDIFNPQEIAAQQTHSQTECITFDANTLANACSERSVKSLLDTRIVAISKQPNCVVEKPFGTLIVTGSMDICSIEENILHPVHCLWKLVASSVLAERNKDI